MENPYIGKTKEYLIKERGEASEIRVYGDKEAYIYKTKEEFFGKKKSIIDNPELKPKKVYSLQKIYYVNAMGKVYKYQFWRKKID